MSKSGSFPSAGAGAGAGAASEISEFSPMPEVSVSGLSERVDVGLATQNVLLAEVGGIKKRLVALQESIDQVKRSLCDDSSGFDRHVVAEQSAIQKLLAQYAKGLSHKQQDLHYYVRPDVITELPGSLTVGEYVAEIEDAKREDTSKKLHFDVDEFLSSDDKVLLLLGEPGAGKSLFAWHTTQARLTQYQQVLLGKDPGVTPWLPVVIELKDYHLDELKGCIANYLQKVCKLGAGELAAFQNDRKPQHKLLVVLDGFDEQKQPAAGEPDISKLFTDCFRTIGAGDWFEGQVKVVVTCRVRHLPDRVLEQQYFGHGEGQHYRRRILLPFNSTKIAAYIKERAALQGTLEEGALSAGEYQAVLTESDSVKEMVRNPFVLRLFVEALPELKAEGVVLKTISRFDIYHGFVSQWFARNVSKLDDSTKLTLGVGELGVQVVAESFAHYAAILATEMYRRNSLVVGLSEVSSEHTAFKVWSGLENRLLEEVVSKAKSILVKRFQTLGAFDKRRLVRQGISDEASFIDKYLDGTCQLEEDRAESGLQAFKKTSPLRRSGEHYSFIHKSFYEYFIAVGIIQTAASDKTRAERISDTLTLLEGLPDYGSRRLWQEPEALDFVCEYWAQASRAEKDQLRETWFGVVESTRSHPEYGSAGGNAATLLNWVNVNMIYKQWQGVHIPGADLRKAYLEGSDLSGADLSGSWLGRMQANQLNLQMADLTGVEFSERPAVHLEGECESIAYHPKENRVAVTHSNSVKQYDFKENRWLEPPLEGHTDTVICVCYSRDGKWVASGGGDKTVRQWDAASGEPRGAPLVGHTDIVTSVSYSGDGQWLASGGFDDAVRQWRSESGEQRGSPLVGHKSFVTSVSYSPDGQWLASGSDDHTIQIWVAATGRLRGVPLASHTEKVTSVTFSDDGQWLASGSEDGTIRQWDAATGLPRDVPPMEHTTWVNTVSYSPDGQWLVSCSDDWTIRQWRAESGELRGSPLVGHADKVTSVSYSGDGKWLASRSWDNTFRQWAAASAQWRGARLLGYTNHVTSVSYSADGKWLVGGSWDGTIRQWDAVSGELRGEPLKGHTHSVASVCYSGDGKWVASGSYDKTIRQWDAATGELRGEPLKGHTHHITCISYSGDGKWLASGSWDHTVRQWDAASGEMRGEPLKGHTGTVTCVSFSPDGQWVASGDSDNTIRQWRSETGMPRGAALEGHVDGVTSVSYSPDGQWLASGDVNGTIQQWKAANGEPRGAPLRGHTGSVDSVSYSGDGVRLASGSSDKTVRQWDAASGEACGVPLLGHTDFVNSVSYSGDGNWLASGSYNGTVRVWRREIEARDGSSTDEAVGTVVWRLAWGTKGDLIQLSAHGMRLSGAIGLEPHQVELLRQRGCEDAIDIVHDEDSDQGALAAGVEESKTVPPEEAETESEVGLEAGQQLVQVGLFAEPPGGAAASGGAEEGKAPDSDAELSGQPSKVGAGM